ncbi:MAG: hypothetical protein ACQPRI_06360 [Solitalea-like symbiont of Tyrophagus putrescentiae]
MESSLLAGWLIAIDYKYTHTLALILFINALYYIRALFLVGGGAGHY